MAPARPWLFGLAALAAALASAGCTGETRHRVLTFLFDGVPGDEEPIQEEAATRFSPLRAQAAERAAIEPPAAPVSVSVHQPVFQRQCGECHDMRRGLAVSEQGMRLCDRCHGERRQEEGWNHGPINLGQCLPCHRAHESPWPHLLQEPVPQLCGHCHRGDADPDAPYHAVPDFEQCTSCHHPHRVDVYKERP